MLGWLQEKTFISDFWDKAEELPGCFMIQREIRKAITGQSFFYNDEDTGKSTHVDGMDIQEFNYYYVLWDDYHWLRTLPHGQGTLAERRWVLETIKVFEKIHKETLNFIEEQQYKRSKINSKNFNND